MKNITDKIRNYLQLGIMTATFTMASCVDDGDKTIVLEKPKPTVSQAPSIDTNTTNIPNISYFIETEGNDNVLRIDMTGIQEVGTSGWLYLKGTNLDGQNVWVDIDGTPKSISVINNSDNNSTATSAVDLVFLVDNSGSMSQEADAIARDIVNWSQQLQQSNLDICFGCVGYSVSGTINGALNLTDATSLASYLNRSSGTNRTIGFAGNDATRLQSYASSMTKANNECGGMALRYADKAFSFRTNANRIYVNFTDEFNQPNKISEYSTESFKDLSSWSSIQGTVHTVYSNGINIDTNTTTGDNIGSDEYPWRISWYTGGTIITANSDFSGVTLNSLPITGALRNSYIIRINDIEDLLDGQTHNVTITIMSTDGATKAVKTFPVIFGTN